jgi:hypothetical protein
VTRPSELRVKEDAHAGTVFDAYRVGERFGPLRFTLKPAFIDEYVNASGVAVDLYQVNGRAAAPPQILLLYLMATLHQRYRPLPATVMAELAVELCNPIWRDEETEVLAEGVIEAKAERRGRRYVTWSAEFRSGDGRALARITNTFIVPR